MLHHSQGESAEAFIRTSGTTPLGQVSLHIQHTNWQTEVDNGPWFVCIGLPLSFLYGWFANNAWFGTWASRGDFVCMGSREHTQSHAPQIHTFASMCTHLHIHTPTGIPLWFLTVIEDIRRERASSLGKQWRWCVWWIFVTMSVWTRAATIPQLFYTINSTSPPFVSP